MTSDSLSIAQARRDQLAAPRLRTDEVVKAPPPDRSVPGRGRAMAAEPVRRSVMWVPPNTARQHINASPDQPLELLVMRNAVFRHIGYDRNHILEPASP